MAELQVPEKSLIFKVGVGLVVGLALVVSTALFTRSCDKNNEVIRHEKEVISEITKTNIAIETRIRWIQKTNSIIEYSNAALEARISNSGKILIAPSLDAALDIFLRL